MKRFLAFIQALCLLFFLLPVSSAAAEPSSTPPEVISDAYVVMDSQTGQVLIEKNMDKREYPASITKILTVAMALEKGKLSDSITVSRDAVYSILPNSSHIALTDGEVVTVEQMVYAAMLPSANDAANVLGEYVSGSLEAFAEAMNAKAKELGAVNSHFVNPSGLPDDDHYTTAYDMALLTKYALTVPGFREVFGAESYTMPPTNKQKNSRLFGTEHSMIVESKYYYEGATGGKLGWTEESKHTIVTVANRGEMELICVA